VAKTHFESLMVSLISCVALNVLTTRFLSTIERHHFKCGTNKTYIFCVEVYRNGYKIFVSFELRAH